MKTQKRANTACTDEVGSQEVADVKGGKFVGVEQQKNTAFANVCETLVEVV